jgi:hypothetical protein
MMPIDVATAERREFWSKDFLSSCHLCKKLLEGLDIFMYRYIKDCFLFNFSGLIVWNCVNSD